MPHNVGEIVGENVIERIVRRLLERGETVSLAESCTGGLCSAKLATYSGVSQVYMGSIVAYSNKVKEDFLAVPSSLLKSMGAVSLPVAVRMAQGVRKNMGTNWAISITGIAGPGGGSPRKPVGTVCFAVCGPGVEVVVQEHFDGSREQIQQASADFALQLLLKNL